MARLKIHTLYTLTYYFIILDIRLVLRWTAKKKAIEEHQSYALHFSTARKILHDAVKNNKNGSQCHFETSGFRYKGTKILLVYGFYYERIDLWISGNLDAD